MLGGPGGLVISAILRGNSFTTSTLHKPLHLALFGGEKEGNKPATT